MPRDYAPKPLQKRHPKPFKVRTPATRQKPSKSSQIKFSWVLFGIACVFVGFALFYTFQNYRHFWNEEKNLPQQIVAPVVQPPSPPTNEPRFDFYRALPSMDVPARPTENATPIATKETAEPEEKLVQSSGVFLQLAALNEYKEAEEMVSKLGYLGFAAHTERYQGSKSVFYRVWVGPFSTRGEAKKIQLDLAQYHYVSVIVVKKAQ